MHRLFLLAFITYVSANTCVEVVSVHDFNYASYGQGIWYEVARYPFPFFNDNTFCTTIEYTLDGDTSSAKYKYIENNKEFSLNYTVKFFPDAIKSGKIVYDVVQGVGSTSTVVATGEDTILAVSYGNYIIIRSCQYNEEYIWILSRSKYPSEKIRTEIDNFVTNSTVIDNSKLLYTRYNDDLCRIEP